MARISVRSVEEQFKTHLDHHSHCDLGHRLTLLGRGYFLSKKRVISKPVSPPASPRVTFLPSAYTEKQGDVWVVWISPQCGVALRLELAFWNLKQGTQLNSQGHSCQRVVTRSLLSCVFTSHFIIGDSGNPLQCCWTNDPGKAEEKSCRLVCVCVCFGCACGIFLLSPFHLLASKLVFRPFHASLSCLR